MSFVAQACEVCMHIQLVHHDLRSTLMAEQLLSDISCLQDYIGQQGRLNLHGMDADIDVMIESKAKELSVLLYRWLDSHCVFPELPSESSYSLH